MSRAFDQVPRDLIEASILSANFSRATETSLLVWLRGGSYVVTHKGQQVTIPCKKGIKQGSRSGPMEWKLITRHVLLHLRQLKGHSWVQTHLTNFADDFHVCWAGRSEQELHRAVKEAAEILNLFEGFGFELNLQKIVVIMKITGQRAHAFHNNFATKRSEGVFLKCGLPGGKQYELPLVSKCDYLGTTLTYTRYEADTVARRIQAADMAYKRLRAVLSCKRVLSLKQRLEVYQTCVLSTLKHGIFASGFHQGEAKAIHGLIMRHLRHMAGSPRHITRETNEHLCSRIGMPTPYEWIRKTWETKCRAWTRRRQAVGKQDITYTVPEYPNLLTAILPAPEGLLPSRATGTTP